MSDDVEVVEETIARLLSGVPERCQQFGCRQAVQTWEVDWITSGERFVGVCRNLGCALESAEQKARDRFSRREVC